METSGEMKLGWEPVAAAVVAAVAAVVVEEDESGRIARTLEADRWAA